MKTLLIVFAVLLVLLTLLSSFGGSIRTSAEPFYDATPAIVRGEKREDKFPDPYSPSYNYQQPNYLQEAFTTATPTMQNMPFSPSDAQVPVASPTVPIPTMQNMPSAPSFPQMDMPPASNAAVEDRDKATGPKVKLDTFEKFEVPEPFFGEDMQYGAPVM